jgi:hypothetical protein
MGKEISVLSKQKIRGSNPEKSSPAKSSKVRQRNPNDGSGNRTRDALLKHVPEAHNLSVYDGQTRIGFIVDLGVRKPSHAYGLDGGWLGVFPTRKAALAAFGGAA